MEITRNSGETATAPSDWFTGTVYIDTVATRARHEGVRMVFVRNRPVGDGLDEALESLAGDVARS